MHHVEFRRDVRRCHHWGANLRSQILMKTDAVSSGRSTCQGSEVARFPVTAALCSVTPHFLQTLKIYGVVNNDLILFSMLVIYFGIYILVYFRLWSICFALLWLQGFKQCFSGVPSLRTRAVYLMLWITFSKCLIFLKKINILFLLGVSRNAVFIYFFRTHKSNTLKVQSCHMWWKSHRDENRLHWL